MKDMDQKNELILPFRLMHPQLKKSGCVGTWLPSNWLETEFPRSQHLYPLSHALLNHMCQAALKLRFANAFPLTLRLNTQIPSFVFFVFANSRSTVLPIKSCTTSISPSLSAGLVLHLNHANLYIV